MTFPYENKSMDSGDEDSFGDLPHGPQTVMFLYHHGGQLMITGRGKLRYKGGSSRIWRGPAGTTYSQLIFQLTEKTDSAVALQYSLPRVPNPLSVTDDDELQVMFEFAMQHVSRRGGSLNPLQAYLVPAHEESFSREEIEDQDSFLDGDDWAANPLSPAGKAPQLGPAGDGNGVAQWSEQPLWAAGNASSFAGPSLPTDMLECPGTPDRKSRPRVAASDISPIITGAIGGFTDDEIADLDLAVDWEENLGKQGTLHVSLLSAAAAGHHPHAGGAAPGLSPSVGGEAWGAPLWSPGGDIHAGLPSPASAASAASTPGALHLENWSGMGAYLERMISDKSSVSASVYSFATHDGENPSDWASEIGSLAGGPDDYCYDDEQEEGLLAEQTALDAADAVLSSSSGLAQVAQAATEERIIPWSEVDWVDCRRLGGGSFGDVFLVGWGGSSVAVKLLEMELFEEKGATQAALFWAEANILHQLRHANVVSFHGALSPRDELREAFWNRYSNDDVSAAAPSEAVADAPSARASGIIVGGGPEKAPDRACLGLVMEYMAGGTLRSLLKSGAPLPWPERARLALACARGMEYLHGQSPPVIHFDLKSDNLLLEGGPGGACKVADFGLSKQKQATFRRSEMALTGTLPWMAPELVSSATGVTEKADVWSFAVVMWELWSRRVPYADMHQAQIVAGLYSGTLRPPVPPGGEEDGDGPPPRGWVELMEDCWATEASLRPAFPEIVQRLTGLSI